MTRGNSHSFSAPLHSPNSRHCLPLGLCKGTVEESNLSEKYHLKPRLLHSHNMVAVGLLVGYMVSKIDWCFQLCDWLFQLEQLECLRSEDTPRRLMITHTIDSCWIPSQNKVEWPCRYRSRSKIITCNTPSHASYHLYQIWKESIQNYRRYRADTIFKVKAEWPWKYRSRSKVITCDTPSNANDDLCQIWKEYKQNCRFFSRLKPKNYKNCEKLQF